MKRTNLTIRQLTKSMQSVISFLNKEERNQITEELLKMPEVMNDHESLMDLVDSMTAEDKENPAENQMTG